MTIVIQGTSNGSSGWVREAEKHATYAATFASHLFYDLVSQSLGGGHDPQPRGSATGY